MDEIEKISVTAAIPKDRLSDFYDAIASLWRNEEVIHSNNLKCENCGESLKTGRYRYCKNCTSKSKVGEAQAKRNRQKERIGRKKYERTS